MTVAEVGLPRNREAKACALAPLAEGYVKKLHLVRRQAPRMAVFGFI